MTFKSIKAAAGRLVSMTAIALVSLFDAPLERVIAQAEAFDRKLHRFIERQDRKIDGFQADIQASFERQAKVADREEGARLDLFGNIAEASREAERAKRIKDRLSALLD